MASELVLCIPGDWQDRTDLVRRVVTVEPEGRYMFAGGILAEVGANDHVPLELAPADPDLPKAFEIAGKGTIPKELVSELGRHSAIAYLRFPLDLPRERVRVRDFAMVLRQAGGMAVKVESAGIAHTWNRWEELLTGTPFDLYSAVVVLVRDAESYYSCGMHHFGLPECAVPRTYPAAAAADLINRFNFWRMTEAPTLAEGHTFSPTADAPRFRLRLERDTRHEEEDLFHNAKGVWCLQVAGGALHD